MSERPTPETERVKGALHTNWDDLLNHARRLECERDEAREALEYIAHAGLSARHIEDYAKEFLRKEEDEK